MQVNIFTAADLEATAAQDEIEYHTPNRARLKRERMAYEEAEREENIYGELSGGCGAEIGLHSV